MMRSITARDSLLAEIGAELEKNQQTAVKGVSLTRKAVRRLLRNKAASVSLVILLLIICIAVFGPFFARYTYDQIDWANFRSPPTELHYFGTDQNARDLMVRVFYGTRISLLVALVATVVSVVIGVVYGAVSGYFGGKIDQAMMRFVDIMYSMPYTLFVILLMVFFGRHVILLFAAIGAVEWLTMARIVRGQTLSLRNQDFVEAARATGSSSWYIILRHIIPNLTGPVVIYATLTIPEIVITESFLSYLGFGVQEPLSSLGTLISEGANAMDILPWLLAFPAVFLISILTALTFIGDGLRDAFDPKDR